MSDKKLIVVVGATGTQGGSVVNTFLQDPSWTVRAITRNASSSKATTLQAKGAEIFEADLNVISSLSRAFQGAHVIFGVTDFMALYTATVSQGTVKPGQNIGEVVHDMEMQQGKNIFDAAAQIPTIERLVYSSLPNVTKLSKGKYTKALHFDAKAKAAEYGQEAYPELWSKTSLIQVGFYLSNLIQIPWMKPRKNDETGAYELGLFNPDSPMSFVAAEYDVGVLVRALVAAPAGKNLRAFREETTSVHYAALLSKVVGHKLEIVEPKIGQGPFDVGEQMYETFMWVKEFGLFGEKVDATSITPEELDPSLKLGTVDGWVKEQNWSGVF